ncbi:MAG: hypothetical protein R3356_09640, partial [Eudoraea sp.]|nr:hypothetical protein [Eudoraea sp.]
MMIGFLKNSAGRIYQRRKLAFHLAIIIPIFLFLLGSCEKFLEPDLPNIARTDEIFVEWDEYRSAGLGLYALQQALVDQLFVLGELRADMLKLTINADASL